MRQSRRGALFGSALSKPTLNFDGNYTVEEITVGAVVYILFTFLTSGILKIQGKLAGDVWLCGGGGGGRHGAYVEGSATSTYSGGGGAGGYSIGSVWQNGGNGTNYGAGGGGGCITSLGGHGYQGVCYLRVRRELLAA